MGVGVDDGVEGVRPAGRSGSRAGEDGDGVFGVHGVEGPPVEVDGASAVEGRGVEEAAQGGLGLAGPEVGVGDGAAEADAGRESAGTDERGARDLAAAYGRPAEPAL